jgi:hypothetical protein
VPPSAKDLEYFTSERFIHDGLLKNAASIVEQVRQTWRKERKVERYAISWPSDAVSDDKGNKISGSILMALPDALSAAEVSAALQRMVKRTKAYGLLLIEQRDSDLRILFETHHGARAWILPLERHGDVLVTGTLQVHDNAECLGLLWQQRHGTS